MTRSDELVDIGIVTQPGIDGEMVDDVIAVAFRGENGIERKSVTTQFDQVIQPRQQSWQPMLGG